MAEILGPQKMSDLFCEFLKEILETEDVGKEKAADWLMNNELQFSDYTGNDREDFLVNAFFDNPFHTPDYRSEYYRRVASTM